ncbi:MAG: hypothetical protein PHY03_06545, partial [Dehalococcoidia bacterium]|nr:hypothetical protein [Dehalococcoidia bacterium]
MILDQIKYIAPELSLLCFALIIIITDLFISNKRALAVIAVVGTLVAAFFVLMLWNGQAVEAFYRTIAIDQFGLFFKLLILAATALVILASNGYVAKFERFQGEFYALLMLSAVE